MTKSSYYLSAQIKNLQSPFKTNDYVNIKNMIRRRQNKEVGENCGEIRILKRITTNTRAIEWEVKTSEETVIYMKYTSAHWIELTEIDK